MRDPIIKCSECSGVMHHGEVLRFFQGRWVCRECLEEDIFQLTTDELIEALNLDTKYVEDF